MRRTCPSRTAGSFSAPRPAAWRSSSSGMLLQRKNDNRDASSRPLRAYTLPGRTGWIAFDAEQEARVDEDALERELDARVEAALPSPGAVEAEQRVDVCRRDRPAIRTPGERGENLPGAAFLVGPTRRPADEDPAAAGCAPQTRDPVGPVDRDRVHGRTAVRHLDAVAPVDRGVRRYRLQYLFRVGQRAHERHADRPQPRPRGKAYFQPVVGVMPVVLPFRVSVHAARIAPGGGPARALAPDGEQRQSRAVQADVNLVRLPEAHDVAERFAPQADLEDVLAVDRKVVTDHDAATRPERTSSLIWSSWAILRGTRYVSMTGPDGGSPTARRLSLRAADRYWSSSAGETERASAMLSNPSVTWSGGSSDATSTSSASRSRIAFPYSVRLSRWNDWVGPGSVAPRPPGRARPPARQPGRR